MKLIVLAFTFFSSVAFASTAKFKFDFHVNSLASDSELARFECIVTQTLTWENSGNFFKCVDQDQNVVNAMNVALTIGFDHDRQLAYTIYNLHGKNGLFSKLGFDNVVSNGAGLKIYYRNAAPRATAQEYLVQSKDDGLLLVIDFLEYIK